MRRKCDQNASADERTTSDKEIEAVGSETIQQASASSETSVPPVIPKRRANYFARADVMDPIQRHLVELYLLDPARKTSELQAFAGVFPNANFMISPNLLTSNTTLDGATLSHRDQGALAVVNAWLAEPRFEKVTPALAKMRSRLMKFTQQADDATK